MPICSDCRAVSIERLRRNGVMAVALLTLPIGAFLYGLVMWVVVAELPELVPGRGVLPKGNPLIAGYAMLIGLLMAWPLWIVLVPAAMWSTWQVRALVETRKQDRLRRRAGAA